MLLTGAVYAADTCSVKVTYRGVDIITFNQKGMFPDSWDEEPANRYSLPLNVKNENRALLIVKAALDKYPEGMLKNNLKKVYLLGTLEFFGLAYGGTYYDDKIYLCVKDSALGYTSSYIEKAFHHEFSSILLKNYSFDELKWESVNHSEFEYGNGGKEALRSGKTSLEFEVKYNKMGFLNSYSTASFEEDFNEICSNVFASAKRFWNLTADYPRIGKKVKMAIDFYSKIDPVFTEEYFKGLGQ
jgi:hypothetical protein